MQGSDYDDGRKESEKLTCVRDQEEAVSSPSERILCSGRAEIFLESKCQRELDGKMPDGGHRKGRLQGRPLGKVPGMVTEAGGDGEDNGRRDLRRRKA